MRNEDGQALLEYILMLVVAISVVTIISIGFRKAVFSLWRGFTREVAAACPGCPVNEGAKF